MHSFFLTYWPALVIAGFVAAFAAGVFVSAWSARRVARQRRQAPRRWPLSPRAIINSEERKVWRWLELAFVDYSVMVKLPVTRFSIPNSAEQGVRWYELLSGLYSTFTVVRADGRVMGCVDLPSKAGRPSTGQRMKASMLAQCGISYMILQPGTEPTVSQIRFKFLGEIASAMPQGTYQAAAIQAASSSLRSSITRGRQLRDTDSSPAPLAPSSTESVLGPDSEYAGAASSGFNAKWQDNSFIMPLDSRKAGL
jgi:hypothetical protein